MANAVPVAPSRTSPASELESKPPGAWIGHGSVIVSTFRLNSFALRTRQGRICRGLLAACGGPGYPSVCVLQGRAHASGRPDQRAQGACATPTILSAPIRPTRNAPKLWLPARQRTGSSSVAPLTQKCASVIVIASIEERPRAHDHAPAPWPYVDCLSGRRGSARQRPYNLHTTAP